MSATSPQRAPQAPDLPSTPLRFVLHFIAQFRWWYAAMFMLETIQASDDNDTEATMADGGSVQCIFARKGVVVVPKQQEGRELSEDDLLEIVREVDDGDRHAVSRALACLGAREQEVGPAHFAHGEVGNRPGVFAQGREHRAARSR